MTRSSGPDAMSTSRLEAFSDGVFAIAITLLVLDLTVPSPGRLNGQSLAAALGHGWPSYFAYVVSFLVIGIIWINHHGMFALVRHVDRRVLFANLALLLAVSVLPFPTRILAAYLNAGDDAHTAAAVYSGAMLMMSVAFAVLWLVITRDERLLHERIDPRSAMAAMRRFGVGTIIYGGTIALSFVSAVATLAVHAALALYYCFDQLAASVRTADASPPADGS